MLHHQYWLLKEFCILSFEKNLNIVIDFSIIYKSIKKSYKILSPLQGNFFFFQWDFFGYELLNYDIGDLWIFCYIIFGLWRGHGPKERVGWLVSFELFGPIQKFEGDQLLTLKYESSNILKFFKEMVEGRGGGRNGPPAP